MGWPRKSCGALATEGAPGDDDSDAGVEQLQAEGACWSRCSCGVQTEQASAERGWDGSEYHGSPAGCERPSHQHCRPRTPQSAPLDITATRSPLHRRRSGLGSPAIISPGMKKRSRTAWALTCAVAATAAFTAGALSSSASVSSSASPPPAAELPCAETVESTSGVGSAVVTDSAEATQRPSISTSSAPLPAATSALAERRVGRGIGDMMRSTSSSSLFFKSIDRDGDGTVRPTELAGFVRQKIGGSAFDADDEVEAGVINAMAAIDRDHDDGLDSSDVFAYWMQLESLLTSDEVAEWVVHAVQLPESVGNIFKENVVTGYDFPELVENDGEALEKELGIKKSSFRKKIVRHIHIRMLGIGTIPTAPNEVTHKLESCATVSLLWSKCTAKGFPVHSYRVQRRAVNLFGDSTRSTGRNASKAASSPQKRADDAKEPIVCSVDENVLTSSPGDDQPFCKEDIRGSSELAEKREDSSSSLVSTSLSDWVTVYHGSELDFVDAGLEYGHNYVFRIQAWSSVGRSEWTTVDISKSLRRLKCNTRPSMTSRSLPDGAAYEAGGSVFRSNATGHWSFLSGSYMVANFVIFLIRAVFSLIAVAAATMRFKRASAKSTLSADVEPVFPWLWRGINAFSARAIGIEVIPRAMLGDKESRNHESSVHDKEIKAVGLHGYTRSTTDFVDNNGAEARSTNRRVMFSRMKSHSTGNLALLDSQKELASPTVAPKILRNKQNRASNFDAEGSAASYTTVTSTPKSAQRFRRRRSSNIGNEDEDSDRRSDGEITPAEVAVPKRNPFGREVSTRTVSTREGSSLDEAEDSGASDTMTSSEQLDYEDDETRCNSCRKLYKFPKRFKHHCCRCMNTFCHKHGQTTHSNFVSCRVPGNCICNVCLELEGFNGKGRECIISLRTTSRSTKIWKR